MGFGFTKLAFPLGDLALDAARCEAGQIAILTVFRGIYTTRVRSLMNNSGYDSINSISLGIKFARCA